MQGISNACQNLTTFFLFFFFDKLNETEFHCKRGQIQDPPATRSNVTYLDFNLTSSIFFFSFLTQMKLNLIAKIKVQGAVSLQVLQWPGR